MVEADLVTAVTTLRDAAVRNGLDWDTRGQNAELASTLTDCAHEPAHHIRLPEPPVLRIEPPTFGIELDF